MIFVLTLYCVTNGSGCSMGRLVLQNACIYYVLILYAGAETATKKWGG